MLYYNFFVTAYDLTSNEGITLSDIDGEGIIVPGDINNYKLTVTAGEHVAVNCSFNNSTNQYIIMEVYTSSSELLESRTVFSIGQITRYNTSGSSRDYSISIKLFSGVLSQTYDVNLAGEPISGTLYAIDAFPNGAADPANGFLFLYDLSFNLLSSDEFYRGTNQSITYLLVSGPTSYIPATDAGETNDDFDSATVITPCVGFDKCFDPVREVDFYKITMP